MSIKTLLEPNKYSIGPAVVWTALIFILSFKAPSINPQYTFKNLDKVVHFTFYFVFVFLWYKVLLYHKLSKKKHFVFFITGTLFLSLIIELAQEYLTINRHAEWLDLLANTTGALSSALLSKWTTTKQHT